MGGTQMVTFCGRTLSWTIMLEGQNSMTGGSTFCTSARYARRRKAEDMTRLAKGKAGRHRAIATCRSKVHTLEVMIKYLSSLHLPELAFSVVINCPSFSSTSGLF